MRAFPLLALAVLALAGCADLLGGPSIPVQATRPVEGDGWNTDNRFRVVAPGHSISIVADEVAGAREARASGVGDVTLEIPDGTWTVTYHVDGERWDRLSPVRIDVTPPELAGLEATGNAVGGAYRIGAGAVVEAGAVLEVRDLGGCAGAACPVVGRALPLDVRVPGDGIHPFLVSARDAAGNHANATVLVRSGEATQLPEGTLTFGVVARYSNTVQLWDLTDLGAYLGRSEARQAAPHYLGGGWGITPADPVVAGIVDETVSPGMTTAEAAQALWLWMYDELEYDETRLEGETLLLPRQTVLDSEDTSDTDEDGDGLVADGQGNGVRGGVCRDLAALYVSLLRNAGVPARLVSGYLAGNVNGFHAWVEFYGGPVAGADPWVPVDVSGLDEPDGGAVSAAADRMGAFLQSFGILSPEYLPLRTVAPEAEVEGWSTALAFETSTPGGAERPAIEFRKDVADSAEDKAVLCMDTVGRNRRVADDERGCGGSEFNLVSPDYVRATERTIDYGIKVHSGATGTKVRAAVAVPFEDAVRPNHVTYAAYGPSVTKNAEVSDDPVHGRRVASFEM